jgi:NAD(P)-dependent dehydrogenase (short-subunit alcohol dehydrogenase family)
MQMSVEGAMLAPLFAAAKCVHQHLDRCMAHGHSRLFNGRERRGYHGGQRDVVEPNDGDILRDGEAPIARLLHRSDCHQVMASTAAVRPRPGLTAYNATKGAVLVLTRSLALELAPDKIRVNAINPVAGDTPMLAGFIGSQDPATVAAGKKRFQESVPLGRLATPDDIAYAALFLCADEASLITGVGLDVDGGRDVRGKGARADGQDRGTAR